MITKSNLELQLHSWQKATGQSLKNLLPEASAYFSTWIKLRFETSPQYYIGKFRETNHDRTSVTTGMCLCSVPGPSGSSVILSPKGNMLIILQEIFCYSSWPRSRIAFINTASQKGWEVVLTQLLKKLASGWRSDYCSSAELCSPTTFVHKLWPNGPGFMTGLMGNTTTLKIHRG